MYRDIALKSTLVLLVLCASTTAQESPAVPIENIRPAVVALTAYNGQGEVIARGSGFFISRDGRLLTNRHLLKGAARVEAHTRDGQLYTVSAVSAENHDLDIIQLQVDSTSGAVPFLTLSNAPVTSGQYVIVVGSQDATAGSVSIIRQLGAAGRNFLLSADLPAAATGGPVINKAGEVMGITARQVVQEHTLVIVIASGRALALVPGRLRTLADWNAGLAAEPPVATEGLFFVGVDRSLNQDYVKALALLEEVARRNPNDAEVRLHCGYARARLQRYEEALRDYQAAVRLAPDYPDALNNLGTMYDRLGRYKEAVEAYAQAIKRQPDFALAYNNLGASYAHLRRYDEAVATYKQALRLAPRTATTHLNLGVAYNEEGRREEAVAALMTAIQLQPDYAEAHNYLGTVLHKLGRRQEAGNCFLKAIQFRPDFAEAYYNLGVYDLVTGNDDSAFVAYGTLKNLNQKLASQLFNLLGKRYTVAVATSQTREVRRVDAAQVSPSRAAIERLIDSVNRLVTTGIMHRGAADSLIAMLRIAVQQSETGNAILKINLLNDFIERVTALINAGELPAEDGQRLIDATNALVNQLSA